MTRPPNFHELFEEPLPEHERDRLLAAHDLVVEAGPPPELPPWLQEPPTPWHRTRVGRLERRRRLIPYVLAATVAIAAFAAGYLARGSGFDTKFSIPMHGTALARHAVAVIKMGSKDPGGNWPMLLEVHGLKPLPKGGYYELFLTRDGKLGPSCGTFHVTPPLTEVRLNAPYKLKRFAGWVITRHVPGPHTKQQVLLRTKKV